MARSQLLKRPMPQKRPAFDIVAFAASAGGLGALTRVLSALPADFPTGIVIVQHLDPNHRSLMADILGRRTRLKVKQAEEGDIPDAGTVFIAPPNRHLLINSAGTLSLSQAKVVRFLRPCADLLLESVAAHFKDRALAVILSGTGTDGARGVCAIKKMGGTSIAQDKESCEFFGMPEAAIRTGDVDFVLPLEKISSALVGLVTKGSNR